MAHPIKMITEDSDLAAVAEAIVATVVNQATSHASARSHAKAVAVEAIVATVVSLATSHASARSHAKAVAIVAIVVNQATFHANVQNRARMAVAIVAIVVSLATFHANVRNHARMAAGIENASSASKPVTWHATAPRSK